MSHSNVVGDGKTSGAIQKAAAVVGDVVDRVANAAAGATDKLVQDALHGLTAKEVRGGSDSSQVMSQFTSPDQLLKLIDRDEAESEKAFKAPQRVKHRLASHHVGLEALREDAESEKRLISNLSAGHIKAIGQFGSAIASGDWAKVGEIIEGFGKDIKNGDGSLEQMHLAMRLEVERRDLTKKIDVVYSQAPTSGVFSILETDKSPQQGHYFPIAGFESTAPASGESTAAGESAAAVAGPQAGDAAKAKSTDNGDVADVLKPKETDRPTTDYCVWDAVDWLKGAGEWTKGAGKLGRMAAANQNGLITRKQLTEYKNDELAHDHDGGYNQLGLQRILDNYDAMAGSKGGVSEDDLTKFGGQLREQATVGMIEKVINGTATPEDKDRLAAMHYYDLAPRGGADKFAQHYTELLKAHNATVTVGPVASPSGWPYRERLVTITDSEGKTMATVPMQVTNSVVQVGDK